MFVNQEPCPKCKEPQLYVIESRSSLDGIRRRKECKTCKHRLTTYEVSASFYKEAQQNKTTLSAIAKLCNAKHSTSLLNKNKCPSCKQNDNGKGCYLSLPEYNTSESFDCNHYVK